jgi:hypothetical protein
MDDINVSKPGKRESFAFVESVPIGVTENRDKVKGYKIFVWKVIATNIYIFLMIFFVFVLVYN